MSSLKRRPVSAANSSSESDTDADLDESTSASGSDGETEITKSTKSSSERSSRAGSRSSSRENSQASISVSADILSTSTSSNSTLAFSAPGAYSRGRERWRSSGAYNLPRKNSSAVDYSAAPFSHRPKVSPVVNQTPEWFVEEPAIVLDDANMIEYRHVYALEFFDQPHVNFIFTTDVNDHHGARACLSVLTTPEPTILGRFASIGNTHRYLLHDENGFEDSVLHNIPAVHAVDLPSKIASMLSSHSLHKESTVYPVIYNGENFKHDLLRFEDKHSRSMNHLKPGQTEIADIWANQPPANSRFYSFLDTIAQKVTMDDQWQGYRGEVGLLSADAGTPVYYKVWNKVEIIFHIAPWMNEEQHRRLIGNDVGVLIYYDSYDEMNAKKANPLDVPEISDEVSMIVNTVQQMLNLTPESFESFSQIFFDALVLTSSDYRLSFKAIIDDPITRMPEFMRNILLFVMKVALEDPSITQATFTTRQNDYTFSGVDANDFETFSLCLVASLKNFLGDQFNDKQTKVWKLQMKTIAALLRGDKKWEPKGHIRFQPFHPSALGIVPQVFGVVEPHPTEQKVRLGFFQRPSIGTYGPKTPPSSHYFSKDVVADWLYTKFYNGFLKAGEVPPLDRLFTIPRREAIKKLGEIYPRMKIRKQSKQNLSTSAEPRTESPRYLSPVDTTRRELKSLKLRLSRDRDGNSPHSPHSDRRIEIVEHKTRPSKKKKDGLSTSSSSSLKKHEKKTSATGIPRSARKPEKPARKEEKDTVFSPRSKGVKAVILEDKELVIKETKFSQQQEDLADIFSNPTAAKIVDKEVNISARSLTKEQEDLGDIFSNPTAKPKK